ncbi:hypothetical protein KIPB_002603 [Kipferlia bialata]|uniref:Protein kinase domain-containing protein n=1 Tax=Kipferlia bialata TaxID=797122 RepID=A0A9K3CQW5_9EUKA|nr:hypothetical protein KIPB_002603 [Kipferlia bialata]|eukprot:g2603.t1
MKVGKKVGDYITLSPLGGGSFGVVMKARNVETDAIVAMKIIQRDAIKTPRMHRHVKTEILAMRRIEHPHIVRLEQVVASKKRIFLIMEYMPNGELLEYVKSHKRLSESQAKLYMRQLLSSLAYCHELGETLSPTSLRSILGIDAVSNGVVVTELVSDTLLWSQILFEML